MWLMMLYWYVATYINAAHENITLPAAYVCECTNNFYVRKSTYYAYNILSRNSFKIQLGVILKIILNKTTFTLNLCKFTSLITISLSSTLSITFITLNVQEKAHCSI